MTKKLFKNYFFLLLLFLLIAVTYFYKLIASFSFHADFARDIYQIAQIVKGKLTLVGPRLSFGGLYAGPYYFYLYVPIMYLSNLNIKALLIFHSLLAITALIILYISLRKKLKILSASLLTLLIAWSPYYLASARSPWNGSAYLPFLLVYLILLFFYPRQKKQSSYYLLSGFLLGIIINYHPSTIIYLLLSLLLFKLRKIKFKQLIIFLLSFALSFLPLLVFELKNNFPMFKNTWKGNSLNQLELSFIKEHYFIPLVFLVYFLLIYWLSKVKFKKLIYILSLIAVIIIQIIINQHLYKPAYRQFTTYQKVVDYVLKNKIISDHNSFNLIQISQDYQLKVPIGHEYRFFFIKQGLKPLDQYHYQQAQQLLIFSELVDYDIKQLNNWEIQQFGIQYLNNAEVYQHENIKIYSLNKTNN